MATDKPRFTITLEEETYDGVMSYKKKKVHGFLFFKVSVYFYSCLRYEFAIIRFCEKWRKNE